MTPRKDISRDERGAAMIYVALFLLSSLWFVSLAIDMGKLTVTKNELQRAADAAALAGASAMDPDDGTIIQDSARVLATYVGSQNTALRETSEPVVINPADITFPESNIIKVTVHRDEANGNAMTTIFARSIGINTLNMTAVAKAKVIPTNKPCEKLAPFGIINQPGGYDTSCGSKYMLKISQGNTQGNFQLVDLPPCNQGPCAGLTGISQQLTCYIETGYSCCVEEGYASTSSEPGNKVGIISKAVKDRFEQDTDQRTNICYQKYLADGKGNGRRVIPCPLIDSFDVNGKKTIKVVGFAAFFLLDKTAKGGQGNFVEGQFINYVIPGEITEEDPPNTMLYTLRLVP